MPSPYPSGYSECCPTLQAPTDIDAPFPDPYNYLLKFTFNRILSFPNVPIKREARISRISFYTYHSTSPVNDPHPHVPIRVPMEREVHFQNQWFINSLICVGFPHKKPNQERREKTFGHRPRSTTWAEVLYTMGCGLVSQGNRLRHNNLYLSAMMPSKRYFPPWLG